MSTPSTTNPNGSASSARVAGGDTQLVRYIQRIMSLDAERSALGADMSEVYQEAKSDGYDLEAMRRCLKLLRMPSDKRGEHLALVDTYWLSIIQGILGGRDEPEPQVAPENTAARGAGRDDALAGRPFDEAGWPNGTFGAGDYALGYADGERLRAEASDKLDPPKRRAKATARGKQRRLSEQQAQAVNDMHTPASDGALPFGMKPAPKRRGRRGAAEAFA